MAIKLIGGYGGQRQPSERRIRCPRDVEIKVWVVFQVSQLSDCCSARATQLLLENPLLLFFTRIALSFFFMLDHNCMLRQTCTVPIHTRHSSQLSLQDPFSSPSRCQCLSSLRALLGLFPESTADSRIISTFSSPAHTVVCSKWLVPSVSVAVGAIKLNANCIRDENYGQRLIEPRTLSTFPPTSFATYA